MVLLELFSSVLLENRWSKRAERLALLMRWFRIPSYRRGEGRLRSSDCPVRAGQIPSGSEPSGPPGHQQYLEQKTQREEFLIYINGGADGDRTHDL